jgi:hypothetical protein
MRTLYCHTLHLAVFHEISGTEDVTMYDRSNITPEQEIRTDIQKVILSTSAIYL